jgi:hypothetical protein
MSLETLTARMVTLEATGHPLGLVTAHAQSFSQAVRSGTPFPAALERAGRSPSWARCLAAAGANDPVAVTEAMLEPMGAAQRASQALRGSVVHPLVSLLTVAVSAAVTLAGSLPGLTTLAEDTGVAPTHATVGFGLAAALGALVIAAAVLASVALAPRWSPLFTAMRRVDRTLIFEAVAALCRDGVRVDRAFEAAAAMNVGAPLRRAAREAGAALAAGRAPATGVLLDATMAGLVATASARGVPQSALDAIARHERLAAQREMAFQTSAVQVVTLLLAGLALTLVGVGWFEAYSSILAKGG